MKKLYKFMWDVGRMGIVSSVFIAEETDVQAAIGQSVYFGEILGKHSDIYGTLDVEDLTVVELPEEVTNLLEVELGSTISGYNPLHYLPEDE